MSQLASPSGRLQPVKNRVLPSCVRQAAPSLKSVLQHYSSHGSNHPNKNPLIDGIELTPEEEDDIIAFLKTLTDHDFVNDPQYAQER